MPGQTQILRPRGPVRRGEAPVVPGAKCSWRASRSPRTSSTRSRGPASASCLWCLYDPDANEAPWRVQWKEGGSKMGTAARAATTSAAQRLVYLPRARRRRLVEHGRVDGVGRAVPPRQAQWHTSAHAAFMPFFRVWHHPPRSPHGIGSSRAPRSSSSALPPLDNFRHKLHLRAG